MAKKSEGETKERTYNIQNLKPIRKGDLSNEELKKRQRNGGKKSVEVKRERKNMTQMANSILNNLISGNVKTSMSGVMTAMGIPEEDMTYTAAVVARLIYNALEKGDPASIRLLGELTGDLSRFGLSMPEETLNVDIAPALLIPDNGRDKRPTNYIGPQAGPQTLFMASQADIIVYGGAAGGGKTYALLLEALRHKDVPGFGAVLFRKNFTQITAEGGLWDASMRLYSQIPGVTPRKTPKMHWLLGGGGKLSFAYLEREEDLLAWQGTEICLLAFDELTHFSKHQFLYMLSRNRSTCGVKPYVRATCNPDADSWVADFISWWIDPDTGYPIVGRSGVIRYMCVVDNDIKWGQTPEELADKYDIDIDDCKSVTFIASRLEDNALLMEQDPKYMANLKSLTVVDRERLLYGNWKIKPQAGLYFKRTQVREMLDHIPDDIISYCRGWDLAATDRSENEDAAFTAGVLMGLRKDGSFVVLDVINQQLKAGDVRKLVKMTAESDNAKYGFVRQRLPQDPGQAGKEQAQSYVSMLAGYDVVVARETGDKATRAEPMAAQWQNGHFDVMIGEWNESYFTQLESFPESKFKDMVDAGSSAFNELTLGLSFDLDNLL